MLFLYMSFIDDESHRRLFEDIYLNYRKQMLLTAHSVLGNASDAEDIVHDVFIKIAKKHMAKIGTIENTNDLRNYLLKATKHRALDHLRKHRRERATVDADNERELQNVAELSDDEFVERICSNIEYKRVTEAIASMKEPYRDALYYHFVLELHIPDMARMLNCKVSTVKQRLVRGKKLLQEQLFGRDQK